MTAQRNAISWGMMGWDVVSLLRCVWKNFLFERKKLVNRSNQLTLVADHHADLNPATSNLDAHEKRKAAEARRQSLPTEMRC